MRQWVMAYKDSQVAEHTPSKHLRAIDVDEVSIPKVQNYAIVVVDLDSFGHLENYNNRRGRGSSLRTGDPS